MTGGLKSAWVIAVSLFLALMLAVWPVPNWAEMLRPEWVALALIYWCMALPNRVGPAVAWITGIGLDALRGTLLGEHALALTLLVYFTARVHLQIRVYPLSQQTLVIMILVALYEFVLFWIDGIAGYSIPPAIRWIPVFTSGILWPWTMLVLRGVRRRYQVA